MQQLDDSFNWVAMHPLVCFDSKAQKHVFFPLYIFPLKTNQMFVIYNNFMNSTHGLHHLKCDLVQKCLLMCFENSIEALHADDIFKVVHNHLTTFIIPHTFN